MVETDAFVTDVGEDGPFVRAALSVPEIAPRLAAGCFVLADLSCCSCRYLRTLLFPARLGIEEFDVLVPPDHAAAALRLGSRVNLVGPLGHGFKIDPATHRLLLVADAVHLPALLPLAQHKPDFSVALLLTAPTAAALYPVRLLPADLEVHIVTGDGSAGRGGSALDLFPDLARWADCVCVAADPALYPALAEAVRQVRVSPGARFALALVVPPLACGVGACQGCAVPTAEGFRLACTDGPVFDLLELR
jgi:dihydroorotate dehydrogenase electron transfer subunit